MVSSSNAPTLITPSYRGDFALFQRLVESVERHVAPTIKHVVVVPPADLGLFQTIRQDRTTLLSTEDVLPVRFWRLPNAINPVRARQDLFIRPGPWVPVRGWMLQQLVKFAAAIKAPTDSIVFVDSDVAFLRPVKENSFNTPDGRLRLYFEKGVCGDLPTHRKWYHATARLLGLPSVTPFWGDNYICDLVTWRRDHARDVLRRVEEVTGQPWWKAMAATSTLSEYILYGVHVNTVLGGVDEHTPTDHPINHSSWFGDVHSTEGRAAFVDALKPDMIAASVQSSDQLAHATRDTLLAALQAKAIEQDSTP